MTASKAGIAAASLLLTLAACAQPPASEPAAVPPPAKKMQVSPEWDVNTTQVGEERELAVGAFLDIELPANASTGYGWEVKEDGQPVLRQVPAPEPAAAAEPPRPMPGAGGLSRWRFVAVQPGSASLHLVYRRPWENDAPPAREVRYRVVVRAAAR